jgi:ferredoxin
MSVSGDVLYHAEELFDTAGITHAGGSSVLVVGLATSPERDLDDFVRDEERVFKIRGFETHMQPLLDSLVDNIRKLGISVDITGHCGYPPPDVLNLKRCAVAAGVATWGKNAMVLHPRFGPRLRLAALKIPGTMLKGTGPGLDGFAKNPLCADCNACIDACPTGVLEPYYMRDSRNCLAKITWSPDPGKVECCDRCWVVCPAGRPAE